MENRLYAFDWKYIGDMELAAPTLARRLALKSTGSSNILYGTYLRLNTVRNSPTDCYIKRDSSLGQNSANGT